MPSWNSIALRNARESKGLTQGMVAQMMNTTVDTVRRVEGSYTRDGVTRTARSKTIIAYCECLGLDEKDYRNRTVRLLKPTYMDFRSNDPFEDDPRAQGWRNGALRIGVGHLEIEVENGEKIRVLEVKLQTDLFDHIAMPPNGVPIAREGNYSKVVSLQHWCEWQSGERFSDGLEVPEDWAALGIVVVPGLPAESQFDLTSEGLQKEAMFSPPPSFATWNRFVKLWAEFPVDINFNLTVRYRDRLGQIYLLRQKFFLDGGEIQDLCKEGFKFDRGFPAFLEPFVSDEPDY